MSEQSNQVYANNAEQGASGNVNPSPESGTIEATLTETIVVEGEIELTTDQVATLINTSPAPSIDAPVLDSEEVEVENAIYTIQHPFETDGQPMYAQIEVTVPGSYSYSTSLANSIEQLVSVPNLLATMVAADGRLTEIANALQVLPSDELREVTEQEANQFLSKNVTGPETTDIFSGLAQMMAYEMLDPILSRFRNRNYIKNLVQQLSKQTQALTGLAERLQLEVYESPVKLDPNFSNWDGDHLQALVSTLYSYCDGLQTRLDSANETNRQLSESLARIKNTDELNKSQAAIDNQALIDTTEALKAKVLEANSILASYHHENQFLVGKVDPTTREIKVYVWLDDEDQVKRTKYRDRALVLTNYDEARELRRRAYLADFKRNGKPNDHQKQQIRELWAVFRTSVNEVIV